MWLMPGQRRAFSHSRDGSPIEPRFDWAGAGHHLLFVLNSVRRHKGLLFSVWGTVIGLSLGLMWALPKGYRVDTTVQIQRSLIIPALIGRSRAGEPAGEADAPSKTAALTVLAHDNLAAIVQQTNLVEEWPLRRAPLMRLKDRIFARLFPPPSDSDRLEGFVGLLEKKLQVTTGEGSVSIGIDLPDPELAVRVVEAAREKFLEARSTAEISSVVEAIGILETRAGEAKKAVDEALGRLQDLRRSRAAKLGAPAAPLADAEVPITHESPAQELQQKVQSKRQAIADLEEGRRRYRAELQTRLDEKRSVYSENHPAVLEAEEGLLLAQGPSPEAAALRQELAPLEDELRQRGLMADVPLRKSRGQALLHTIMLRPADPHEQQDTEIEYARSQLGRALSQYNGLLDRLEGARLERDTAQAVFKYRYSIMRPAQSGPARPRPSLVLMASLLSGLVVGIFGTALADYSSRKLIEPWQVEHSLGVPLVGELSDSLSSSAPNPLGAPISHDLVGLWYLLVGRPWSTLAIVSPEDGPGAWQLAQGLVEVARKSHSSTINAVKLLDLKLERAASVARAVNTLTALGERKRFVLALDSPVGNPGALIVLAACDAVLLLLERGQTRIPEARKTVESVGRQEVLGAVFGSD
jgi:hypothetical protein